MKVLPKRDSSTVQIGDWENGKRVYWVPHNLMNCTVREDKEGFLRLYDGRREGWVKKDDMVMADDAPARWDQTVKQDPKNYFVWYMRGQAWYKYGDYDKAVEDLTEAIRLKPDGSFIYQWRGIVFHAHKDYAKSIADHTVVIRHEPSNADAYIGRGNAWTDYKGYDNAIADFDEAIRLAPNIETAFNNRGCAWLGKKEYKKAIADCSQAIRLAPKYADAYANRALALAKINKYDVALIGFVNAIKLNPSDWIHRDFAKFRASCPDAEYRDGKTALSLARKALEKAGPNADWQYSDALAMAFAECGEFDSAVNEQQKAFALLKAEKFVHPDDVNEVGKRLQLYRDKKPYRDK